MTEIQPRLIAILLELKETLVRSSELVDKGLRNQGLDQLQVDPNNLVWTRRNGQKGSFQIAQKLENPSLKYLVLAERIRNHRGFMSWKGWLYWLLDDGSIGRRPDPRSSSHL